MKKLIVLLIVTLCLLTACNGPSESPKLDSIPAPTPTPAPSPAPTVSSLPPSPTPEPDIPEISEEEMAAFLWNKLPHYLPDDYTKYQFSSETGEATYCGDKKWEFCVYGTDTESSLLPPEKYEKTPGNWVHSLSREVTTYTYILTADYYENTGSLDIISIRMRDKETTIQIESEKSIVGKGLKVKWITATTSGSDLRVEGSVKNIGVVPLEDVIIEVILYDAMGDWLRTDEATLTPSKIDVGETGQFFINVLLGLFLKASEEDESGKRNLGSYNYKFLLPSGEELYFETPD